jgi:hypothetical protein
MTRPWPIAFVRVQSRSGPIERSVTLVPARCLTVSLPRGTRQGHGMARLGIVPDVGEDARHQWISFGSAHPVMAEPNPLSIFDNDAIAAVIELAAHQLAAVATAQHITVLIAWPNRPDTITPSHGGWCELGRIAEPAGRFWWVVRRHPERGEGRLKREFH